MHPNPTDKSNVILVVIDCLRADRLFSQHRTCRTPHIDRLRRQGTSLTNVFVENSLTPVSFASILTGCYSGKHGITGMAGVRLNPGLTTMAEVFASNGYHTYAEFSGPLSKLYGLDKGFAHYHHRHHQDYFFTPWGSEFIRRLERGRFEAPYFLMVHFWEVHRPRQVPAAYDTPRWGTTGYDRSISALDTFIGDMLKAAGPETAVIITGDHGECVDEEISADTIVPHFLKALGIRQPESVRDMPVNAFMEILRTRGAQLKVVSNTYRALEEGGGKLSLACRLDTVMSVLRTTATYVRSQTQQKSGFRKKKELHRARAHFGMLINILKGDWQRVLKHIVSDALVHANLKQHGYHIYDYLQNVPVVLYKDGLFPKESVINTELRHIDLMPTLAEAFRLKMPAHFIDGRSYMPDLSRKRGLNRKIYMEARGSHPHQTMYRIRGLRWNSQKVAFAPFDGRAPMEYYDLAFDPAEKVNLANKNHKQAGQLREMADAIAAGFQEQRLTDMSHRNHKEMLQGLKNTGYM